MDLFRCNLAAAMVLVLSCGGGNPFLPDELKEHSSTQIGIIALSPEPGSTVGPADTMNALVEVLLPYMDTSGGYTYRFNIGHVTGKDRISTSLFHGIYSLDGPVDTIEVHYPFRNDFEEDTTGRLAYRFYVGKGTSLLSPSVILDEYFLEYSKL